MPEIVIPYGMLFSIVREFSQAEGEISSIKEKLEKDMKSLEKTWKSVGKEQFFNYYHELDNELGICIQMMGTISREMTFIAERFKKINEA